MANNPMNPKNTAGSVTVTGGAAVNLLDLIRAQLDTDCIGTGQEVNIQADSGIEQPNVYIGRESPLGGDVSASNYGYVLTAGSSRTYRSSYPGNESPVAEIGRASCRERV